MKKIPFYELDCSLPLAQRWDALPKSLRASGRILARRGIADLAQYKAVGVVGVAFRLITKWRNPYRGEIKGAARVLGIDYNEAVTLNFQYEISQMVAFGSKLWEGKLGDRLRSVTATLKRHAAVFRKGAMACTAGARYVDCLGMTHVRSLDWPVAGLGRHTLIIHHVNNPTGNFFSVGWPGYSGALSGYKPGAFSATINQADVIRMPNLQWPPAHLLRWVFENCRTYNEALQYLRHTPVCFPAFVLLAGPDNAAVIEMGPDGSTVKPMKAAEPVVIANDYVSAKRRKMAGVYGQDGDSDHRRNVLLRRLRRLGRGTIAQALRLVRDPPVANADSRQQMVVAHGPRSLLVVGRENKKTVSRSLIGPL